MHHDPDCCKAGRVAAKYGIAEKLEKRLGNQWEAANGPGLRKLVKQFNMWVINAALLAVGEPALEGEADLLYRLLTNDEVEDAERARARRRIEEQGIDPDDLADDFISYKTLDRHFKNCTDREREPSSTPVTTDAALNNVNALKGRLERVTAKSIAEVAQHTDLGTDGSDIDVIVQITIVCPECGDRLPPRDLFGDGCSCAASRRHSVIQPSTTNNTSSL